MLARLSNALARRLQRFLAKEYRDGYLETHVRGSIALQIRALREKAGLTQEDFARITGKKQSTVSRLENTEYGKVSVQTLLDIACSLNVALLVRFVDYPQFLRSASDMSPNALAPEDIFQSQAQAAADARRGLSEIFLRGRTEEGQAAAQEAQDIWSQFPSRPGPVPPMWEVANRSLLNEERTH